jgi:hypothetical protein
MLSHTNQRYAYGVSVNVPASLSVTTEGVVGLSALVELAAVTVMTYVGGLFATFVKTIA